MTTPAQPQNAGSQPAPGAGGSNVFTRKLGPLPLWGWMGIGLAVALGYYFWQKNKAASTASTSTTGTTGTTDQNLIPQFVNQVYTDNTVPPEQGPPGPQGPQGVPGTPGQNGGPPPGGQQLTRTWTSEGGSTLAAVTKRLTGNSNVDVLTPSNTAAKNWLKNVYAKNHNAKMPKGLTFTYNEGTVTNKPGTKTTKKAAT